MNTSSNNVIPFPKRPGNIASNYRHEQQGLSSSQQHQQQQFIEALGQLKQAADQYQQQMLRLLIGASAMSCVAIGIFIFAYLS